MSILKRLEENFDKNCEKVITWVNTPTNNLESVCCVDCCDPRHSYEFITGTAKFNSPIPKPYLPHTFVQETHKVYDPDRDTGIFSMQTTFEERKVEYVKTNEWKAGGCKSWRELFNLD